MIKREYIFIDILILYKRGKYLSELCLSVRTNVWIISGKRDSMVCGKFKESTPCKKLISQGCTFIWILNHTTNGTDAWYLSSSQMLWTNQLKKNKTHLLFKSKRPFLFWFRSCKSDEFLLQIELEEIKTYLLAMYKKLNLDIS